MSVRTTAAGIGVVIIAGALLYGVVMERAPSDTDLPPDPFESNEPRVIDCVGDWQSPQEPAITADIYCEIGDGEHEPDDHFDAQSVERHPYIWSTTGNSGQVAIIDMYLSRETSGVCEIWVDGNRLEDESVTRQVEEGENGDIIIYYCGIEVTIP